MTPNRLDDVKTETTLLPKPIESIEFTDDRMGLNPVLLAVTLEGTAFPPFADPVRRFSFVRALRKGPLPAPALQRVGANAAYSKQTGFGWVNHDSRSDPKAPGHVLLSGRHHFRVDVPDGLYEVRLGFHTYGYPNYAEFDVTVEGVTLVQRARITPKALVVSARIQDGTLDLVLNVFPKSRARYLLARSLEIAPARRGIRWPQEAKRAGAGPGPRESICFGWDTTMTGSTCYAGLRGPGPKKTPAAFSVRLPNGTYACELRISASWYGHPLAVNVLAEERLLAEALRLGMQTLRFDVGVEDDRLDLRIILNEKETRSRYPLWEVHSLVISPRPETTVP